MNYNILVDDIARNKEQFDKIHDEADLYGGSTVASICGVGYQSPLEVWLRKTGKTSKQKINAQMSLGSFLETFVRDEFARRIGREVAAVNQVWQSVERPWMIASPDAEIKSDGDIVEIKTGRRAGNAWSDKSASDSAMCQLQWYLAVSGHKGGYCVGMFGGDAENLYTPYFTSEPGIQSQLIERVEQFRDFVKKDIPPQAGPGDAALIREYLLRGVEKEKEIDLTETHSNLVKEWEEVQCQIDSFAPAMKQAEERQKALKNQILQSCNGAAIVKIGTKTFYVNEVVRNGFTVAPTTYFNVKMKEEK